MLKVWFPRALLVGAATLVAWPALGCGRSDAPPEAHPGGRARAAPALAPAFRSLPPGWHVYRGRAQRLTRRRASVQTIATSWAVDRDDPRGPAHDLPPGGIMISVHLLRRSAGGRVSPSLCRSAERMAGYPVVRELPMRMPRRPAAVLEGYPEVPEYWIFGTFRSDYQFEARVDVNDPRPGPALRSGAEAALEGLRFPDWPNRCVRR